jgi:hypothetical protein
MITMKLFTLVLISLAVICIALIVVTGAGADEVHLVHVPLVAQSVLDWSDYDPSCGPFPIWEPWPDCFPWPTQ